MPLRVSNVRKGRSDRSKPGMIACTDFAFSRRLLRKHRRAEKHAFQLPLILFRKAGRSVAGKERMTVLQIFLSVIIHRVFGNVQRTGSLLAETPGQIGIVRSIVCLFKNVAGSRDRAPIIRALLSRFNFADGGRVHYVRRGQEGREVITRGREPQRGDGSHVHAGGDTRDVTGVSLADKSVDASRAPVRMLIMQKTASFMIQGSILNRFQAGSMQTIRNSHYSLTCLAVPGHEGGLDRWMSLRGLRRSGSPGAANGIAHTAQSGNALPGVSQRPVLLGAAQRADSESPLRGSPRETIAGHGTSDRRSFPHLTGTFAGPQRRGVPETFGGELSFHGRTKIREEVEELKVAVREVREAVREESRSVRSVRDEVEGHIKRALDIHRLSDQVYQNIERRIRTERERRGL